MNKKIVYIALDACDPALAQRFASEGRMPNLKRLLETAARAPVENPHGLFVGSLWANFGTALRPEHHGFHCWDGIDPSNYEYRYNTPGIGQFEPFWCAIGKESRKVCVIDVPHHRAAWPANGIQIFEWGCHDKHFGLTASPPELASEIGRRFGYHPALSGADPFEVRDCAPDDEIHRAARLRTTEEDFALLQDLLIGVQRKTALTLDLLQRDEWDLFVVVFGESHAIGHQQWHLHDADHPRHDPAAVAAMGGDPVAQVYAALDKAVGDVMDAASDADLCLLHLSHGMGPHYDGTHLLEEVLVRLEAGAPAVNRNAVKDALRPFVPALQGLARAAGAPAALRKSLGRAVVTWPPTPAEARSKRRFFMEPNNTVYGGVRINLVGREPMGVVRPEELESTIARLEADLLELRNVDTGRPVVRAVQRCENWHRRSPTDSLPDLFIDWERSALIENVTSPKIGTVSVRYDHWRTGDHRPAGLLLAKTKAMTTAERRPGLAVEDIGPSLAARLGVELPDVDGIPAAWLVDV